MKITIKDAEAAGRRASKIYDETRYTGGDYRKFVEDVYSQIAFNPDMTDKEKREARYAFDRTR